MVSAMHYHVCNTTFLTACTDRSESLAAVNEALTLQHGQALTSAAKAERSAAVRRAYAAACAQLAAHAPEARAAKLASTIVELCSDGGWLRTLQCCTFASISSIHSS